jgi:ornithine carbamoyltransferase
MPNLLKLAKEISPDDNKFTRLHPAQLIKHILGLKEKFGKNKFRLLYLWYDTIGPESAKYHKEIEKFIKITKADNIHFHAMSYQDLIIKLAKKYRGTDKNYIDYISGRYL